MTQCSCFSHGGFLTERGYAELAQREVDWPCVDSMDASSDLDIVGSVSAFGHGPEPMTPVFVDKIIDEQARRFHSGS